MSRKVTIFKFATFALTLVISLAAVELALRLKNSSMKNYDIEMWQYARKMVSPVDDSALAFTHRRNVSGVFQGIDIRLNEFGLRGDSLAPTDSFDRRILFLGGSSTLGWGVPEEKIVTERIEKRFRTEGMAVEVINGGVPNHNADRYVERYFKELSDLPITDIVVHFFHRDAEELVRQNPSNILRSSMLAYTLYLSASRFVEGGYDEEREISRYKEMFDPKAERLGNLREELSRLAEHAKKNDISLYLAVSPEIRNLRDYRYDFVGDAMQHIAKDYGYTFIELLPSFENYDPEKLFVMPGDPHPNALAHKLMAEAIYPVLADRSSSN